MKSPLRIILFAFPFLLLFCAILGFGTQATDTANSLVYSSAVGGNESKQYRIAAATAHWFSDVIDVRGKSVVAMQINDATGDTDAVTGTVGAGDFFLRGIIATGDIITTTKSFVMPYHYSPMLAALDGIAATSDVSIDLYGLNLYDVGALTHVFVLVTTNDRDNTIIIAVE